MASKQFEKGQIVTYNDCGLSLCDIANKLNYHHLSIDVFLKKIIIIKLNYHQIESCGHKRKTAEDTKF